MGTGFSCHGFYFPLHVKGLQQQWWYERLENTQLGQISVLFHRSGARIYLQVPRVCVGLWGGFQYQVFPRESLWLACNLHCISMYS